MKKIISAILVATMFVACFAMSAAAATIWTSEPFGNDTDLSNGLITVDATCDSNVFKLTYTYEMRALSTWADSDGLAQPEVLEYDNTVMQFTNAQGTIYLNGAYSGVMLGEGAEYKSEFNNCMEPEPGYVSFPSSSWKTIEANTDVKVVFEFYFDILVTEETTTSLYLYIFGGHMNSNIDVEEIVEVTVTPAAAAPEYTKPATPVAQSKAACEACGTEAGVRFLMTVDKTAADYADVTAYGVVIAAGDKEYKYTADANTKKAETDTKIEYAVVVTGAPAGTTFTATAFLMYGDVEVAGVSGELTA